MAKVQADERNFIDVLLILLAASAFYLTWFYLDEELISRAYCLADIQWLQVRVHVSDLFYSSLQHQNEPHLWNRHEICSIRVSDTRTSHICETAMQVNHIQRPPISATDLYVIVYLSKYHFSAHQIQSSKYTAAFLANIPRFLGTIWAKTIMISGSFYAMYLYTFILIVRVLYDKIWNVILFKISKVWRYLSLGKRSDTGPKLRSLLLALVRLELKLLVAKEAFIQERTQHVWLDAVLTDPDRVWCQTGPLDSEWCRSRLRFLSVHQSRTT